MKRILLLITLFNCYSITNAQWFWQNPLPQGNSLNSVKFITSTVGWVLQLSGTYNVLAGVSFTDANNGTVVGQYGIILRTTNGGTTWLLQPSGTANDLNGVSFTDVNNGTAVGDGGTILRTTNGGITWTSQLSDKIYLLNGVFFTDANNGTAVGCLQILRTTDGGTTLG
ncbi:MAG: YCF48-related protein [Ignavibacteriales bacterium]|nr:YCF48-related protein [Ignavibacteriales bacterium]